MYEDIGRLEPVPDLRPWERRLVLPYPAAKVGETWVQESAFDTSFDTNPKQQCETSGNAQSSDSACLDGFCNRQKRLETYRPRLKIMVSPGRVRILLLPKRWSLLKKSPSDRPVVPNRV